MELLKYCINMKNVDVYPIFEYQLTRSDREGRLGQRATMVWFTGLSGSGKSTLALALESELARRGVLCYILDGDNIRSGLNGDLGFDPESRVENIRRIAEVGRLFVDCGVVAIVSSISPTEELRNMAREIVGDDDFMEIYMSTPIEECERRDVKGLYRRARSGAIAEFTGVSQPFEEPRGAIIAIDTTGVSVESSVAQLLEVVLPRITFKNEAYAECR